MTLPTLPTVEQAKEFHAVINAGRVAAGLEPLEALPYDKANPGSTSACLSALSLFAVLPGASPAPVGVDSADMPEHVASAIGVTERGGVKGYKLPPAILNVTDVFDASYNEGEGDEDYAPDKERLDLHVALRDRLVEAGVVA